MKKHTDSWKSLEKTTAEILGGKRNIRVSYSERNTDVFVKDFPQLKIDSKRYKRHAAYTLYLKVQKKYCKDDKDIPVLILRQNNKQTVLAVIDIKFLGKLLNIVRHKEAYEELKG